MIAGFDSHCNHPQLLRPITFVHSKQALTYPNRSFGDSLPICSLTTSLCFIQSDKTFTNISPADLLKSLCIHTCVKEGLAGVRQVYPLHGSAFSGGLDPSKSIFKLPHGDNCFLRMFLCIFRLGMDTSTKRYNPNS
jgi:hypothetical protein